MLDIARVMAGGRTQKQYPVTRLASTTGRIIVTDVTALRIIEND